MNKEDCIFCQIANKRASAKVFYETEEIIAFEDLHKDAPEHILVIPKKHLMSLNEATNEHKDLLGQLLLAAQEVARLRNIDQTGYRCLVNTRQDAGQIINHLHLHVLGGQKLGPIICKKDL